jgi:hypothetical protein
MAGSRAPVQRPVEAAGAMKMWKTHKTGFPHFHRALENSPPQKTRLRVSHSSHRAYCRASWWLGFGKNKNLRGE